MQGILYLEDGTTYIGKGFGTCGTSVGELVFNTSMVGYEEVLTDPSYAGQVITMTYPLIGNYGVNENDMESNKIYARGFIVRNISSKPSNYMCEGDIDSFLKHMNVVGLHDVDTRSITKHIRSLGTMKCVISNEEMDKDKLAEILNNKILNDTYVEEVSTKETIHRFWS
jgi:carbamoyl-phosphate synthase small subunit